MDVKNNLFLEMEKDKIALYCVEHKLPNFINVVSKRCLYNGCKKRPYFGDEKDKIPLYCAEHKLPNFIDVKNKRCLHNGCKKRPYFGDEKDKIPLYCAEHKLPNFIDVKNKRCLHNGCKKRPIFGDEKGKIALYCAEHKLSNFINVNDKQCLHNGCKKRPIFGDEKDKIALYCVEHKLPNFIDVHNKHCIISNCYTRAIYGPLYKKKIHCAKHKQNNEFKVCKPICINEDCKEFALYTDQILNFPLRCEDHKIKEDKNVIERKCSSCNLMWYIKEGNMCQDCSEFKDEKRVKTKELSVKNLFDAYKIEYETWDQIPKESCNKYRPDLILNRGNHLIITEVDENQHRSYTDECELARMFNLSQDFGQIPITFIRYNPDSYRDQNNNIQRFRKIRENRLIQLVKSIELHPPKLETVNELNSSKVIYLFYDGDNGENKFQNLIYTKDNTIILQD